MFQNLLTFYHKMNILFIHALRVSSKVNNNLNLYSTLKHENVKHWPPYQIQGTLYEGVKPFHLFTFTTSDPNFMGFFFTRKMIKLEFRSRTLSESYEYAILFIATVWSYID